MKNTKPVLEMETSNFNEMLRLQRILARENPDMKSTVKILNPKMASIKMGQDSFFTVKMNDSGEFKIDALYKGEDRLEASEAGYLSDDWLSLMHFITEVSKAIRNF